MAQLAFVLSEDEERCREQGGRSWDKIFRPLVDEARILCRRAGRSVAIVTAEGDEIWSSDEDR